MMMMMLAITAWRELFYNNYSAPGHNRINNMFRLNEICEIFPKLNHCLINRPVYLNPFQNGHVANLTTTTRVISLLNRRCITIRRVPDSMNNETAL
jgi:hypothetical protein